MNKHHNAIFNKLAQKKGYTVLFTPDDDTYEILTTLINEETKSIKIAIFNFTDGTIAKALKIALTKKISVEIITDRSSIADRYTKIDELYYAGARIYIFNPAKTNKKNGLMHNKFIIFESNFDQQSLVWTGSYNLTRAAHNFNQENVIVLNRKGIYKKYTQQFETIKKRSDLYRPFIANQKEAIPIVQF
jgi:phosphatidylserine/phosphatidylglycerophosphate/cardiolipin synthase-like enzyme